VDEERTPDGGLADSLEAIEAAWAGAGDGRAIRSVTEVSAFVSTNRVFRVGLDDGRAVVAKVSSYGSYFLFAEDHDRLHRWARLLRGTEFDGVLADVLERGGRAYTWYDGRRWVAFYEEIGRAEQLPRILTEGQIECLGETMAHFHQACEALAPGVPPTSNSVKLNAIDLLDQLASPFAPRNFDLPPEAVGVLWRHTHEFLLHLHEVHYDEWPKLPVLVDWNLGNFSVRFDGPDRFRLFSRWDYDWFRVDTRLLDFYFLSRVSSRTGDRTQFTYSSHTLTEPRFVAFVKAYHRIAPLTEHDIRFLPEVYRFFLLNYVIRQGAAFFRPDLCQRFRRETARTYLPQLAGLDLRPLLRAIGA
jgi:Ser/Thr protein kinase RdoA (MazF antagonist)